MGDVPAIAVSTAPATTTTCAFLLDTLEARLHANRYEWIFFRELRLGTGSRNGAAQRVDAFALHTLLHTAMKRVCYEVKVSRADFLLELKQPLKRRLGMRYSNEFYFVTPAGLLHLAEIPAECGLVEIGHATPGEYQQILARRAGVFDYDPASRTFCVVTVPAPWRDTPGPTWQLLAAMLRHQRRQLEERPPPAPAQQKLTLE